MALLTFGSGFCGTNALEIGRGLTFPVLLYKHHVLPPADRQKIHQQKFTMEFLSNCTNPGCCQPGFCEAIPFIADVHQLSLHYVPAMFFNSILMLASSAAASLAAAVTTHVLTLHIESDTVGWKLCGAFALSLFLLFYTFAHKFGILSGLLYATIVAASFTASLIISIGLHRTVFHRLRRFPGPFFARVSCFWQMYKLWDQHIQCQIVNNMHKQYGDIVRCG